jgi:hypothetical protein
MAAGRHGNINDAIPALRIAPPLRTSIRPKCPTRHVTSTFTMEFSISSLLLFSFFLAIFLLITVPLTGGLVRLRANYNPKGLQLDPEDGVQPHTGPVITSFFKMLYRVRNLEVSVASYEGSIDWLNGNTDTGLERPYEGHEYVCRLCYSSNLPLHLFCLTSADFTF